jgi:hypothetical protein
MFCQIVLYNKKKFIFCVLLIPFVFCVFYFLVPFPDSWEIWEKYISISLISIILSVVFFLITLCFDIMLFEKKNKDNVEPTNIEHQDKKENTNIQATINKRFSLNTLKLLSEKTKNPLELEKEFHNTLDNTNRTAIMIPLEQKRSFSQQIKINNYFRDTMRNNSFREIKKHDSLKKMIDSTKILPRSKSF